MGQRIFTVLAAAGMLFAAFTVTAPLGHTANQSGAPLGKTAAAPVDSNIQILDPSFQKYLVNSAQVKRLAQSARQAEGPVWLGDMRSLLFSDIPNDQILKWDEETGKTTIFRKPSNQANGIVRDRYGRLITCEHGRRVTRTEYDGTITVLADSYQGRKLNSPNDVIVRSDDSIWFTDPSFGLEGHMQDKELDHEGLYRIDGKTGELRLMGDDFSTPNGLAFSADESVLYVVENGSKPNQRILAFDVVENGAALSNKRVFVDYLKGIVDGIKVDTDGNLWCGWGGTEELNGVAVFNPMGKQIGFIKAPERISNLVFGGENRSGIFMTGYESIYYLTVKAQGAVPQFAK